MQKLLKIGHRGAKGYVVENTLESIEKALELHVDGVEIDVHLCASGELVVFHDFTLDRMTNGSGEVSKHTLTQLKQLKVKERFVIPTLEDVIDLIDHRCFLNVELKGKNTAMQTCNVLKHYIDQKNWHKDDFLISSFQHHELETVFKIDEDFRLGVLTKASVTDAIEFASTINAFAVHPNVALLTKNNVKFAQQLGFKVYTWTVNDDGTIDRMKAYGVDAIISDVPDRL
ncbi:glycerophosphodiester phosphodiesterase family protein [uncultured Psychroserpens sp.]|uniref:glycerophosphodiester phosphodiesterase n=1 Tax=uncultured Psychroserpens sp. TaxID=255436 RepID=UPI002602CC1C|nr:glycerophosphodiester phosphodiesterase family protein [uncultured Psychroserpens sp.]